MNDKEYLERIRNIMEEKAGAMPATAPIVAMFLRNYRPILPPEHWPGNMTSIDIARILEDTCHMSTTDIALVMLKLGYELYHEACEDPIWAIYHVDDRIPADTGK